MIKIKLFDDTYNIDKETEDNANDLKLRGRPLCSH